MIHQKRKEKGEEAQDKRALHHQARADRDRQIERETKRQMLQYRYGFDIDSEDEIN